jgi:hypothetical protein
MFPIPTDRTLSIREIADYWSRAIDPHASPRELCDTMIKSWWRGELLVPDAPRPIDMLRFLYANVDRDEVVFVIPGAEPASTVAQLEDGSVLVDLHCVRVPLPNGSPESWTTENCGETLEAIAKGWDEKIFRLLSPGLVGISLNIDQFLEWVDRHGFDRPTFWGTRPLTPRQAKGPRRTGTAGRPPTTCWLLPEAERRIASGEFPGTLKEFAEGICAWASNTPEAKEGWPVPKPTSLANTLRERWNKRQKPPPAR